MDQRRPRCSLCVSSLAIWFAALLFASTSAFGQVTTKVATFHGYEWSIEVPEAYTTESSAQPDARVMMIGLTTAPRADGSRPLIQVTLVVPDAQNEPSFRKAFGEQMIAGIQKRRENWKVEVAEVTVGKLLLTRFQWSGVTVPAPDGAAQRRKSRGVMLTGYEAGVAFALHTQDVEEYADETLTVGERALRSFQLRRAAVQSLRPN